MAIEKIVRKNNINIILKYQEYQKNKCKNYSSIIHESMFTMLLTVSAHPF